MALLACSKKPSRDRNLHRLLFSPRIYHVAARRQPRREGRRRVEVERQRRRKERDMRPPLTSHVAGEVVDF